MKLKDFFKKNEKPLDTLVSDGGFCGIFRKIGCIGDSLSSGEMESLDKDGNRGYHDYFEYSWGQYIARDAGCEALNFSQGGMTSQIYCESFADERGFWDADKACQAYIIAMGVNDVSVNGKNLGDMSDVDVSDWKNNKKTFAGYYAQIIQRKKEVSPKAKFFLVTIPKGIDATRDEAEDLHQKILYDMAKTFDNTYVVDLRKYAPVYDKDFMDKFFMGNHLNAAGYRLTAKMLESYIDYIIRHNMVDFKTAAFIDKDVDYYE